jgi:hypothetical protein
MNMDSVLNDYGATDVSCCSFGAHVQAGIDVFKWKPAHQSWYSPAHVLVLKEYILFTDEMGFTCDGIKNTRNFYLWTHKNPCRTVVCNFHHNFPITV